MKNPIVERMVEVLVIFGLLGWLFLTFLEWLSTLPVFPAVVIAAVLCPILSARDYLRGASARFVRGQFGIDRRLAELTRRYTDAEPRR